MAWLVRGEQVLCPLEVASARMARLRGLIGRDGLDGALLLPGCRSVHTLGMRFPIDVAFLGGGGRVVGLVTPMRRWRVGRARWQAHQVIEAEAGAFARWRIVPGDVLEIR